MTSFLGEEDEINIENKSSILMKLLVDEFELLSVTYKILASKSNINRIQS